MNSLETTAPVSARHIRDIWPQFRVRLEALSRASMGAAFNERSFEAFCQLTRQRLIDGARDYGDGSFSRIPAELIGEMQQEIEDGAAGWASILWGQLDPALRILLMITCARLYRCWQEMEDMRGEV